MPKWFQPTTLLCAALFAISPFVIAKIGESHARALFPGGKRFDEVVS